MPKYEIMFIVDPKKDIEVVQTLVSSIFKNPKLQKLDQTELAYEINKSKIAHYVLVNVDASGQEIAELTTKVGISKEIWRFLAINLEKEIGKDKSIELIARRKEKLHKEYQERLKQREARMRDSNERPERPYRRFDRYQNKPPFKEGE